MLASARLAHARRSLRHLVPVEPLHTTSSGLTDHRLAIPSQREGVTVKIYRYRSEGGNAYAATSEKGVVPAGSDLFNLRIDPSAGPLDLERLDLLTPVRPGKIVAVGRNYADHAKELGNEAPPEPIIFLKPPSALLDPEATIVRPPASQRVDFEGELVIVIGKRARNVKAAQWRRSEERRVGKECRSRWSPY